MKREAAGLLLRDRLRRGLELLRLWKPDPTSAGPDRADAVPGQGYDPQPAPEPIDDDDDDYEPPAPGGP